MTYFDVYICNLEDPGAQKRVRREPGAPKRLSPFFPGAGYYLRCQVLARIKDGTWSGWQADWGCWVARLKPSEIRSFIGRKLSRRLDLPAAVSLVGGGAGRAAPRRSGSRP